jgi:hypothetical protein
LDELDGIRLRQWRSPEDEERRIAEDAEGNEAWSPEEHKRLDSLPDSELSLDELHRHRFEKGLTSIGEDPMMLALLPEGDAEFEII